MTFVRESEYKTRAQVRAAYPHAVRIVRVCGGWAVFDTQDAYATWRKQR